jgi:hypothetical protein
MTPAVSGLRQISVKDLRHSDRSYNETLKSCRRWGGGSHLYTHYYYKERPTPQRGRGLLGARLPLTSGLLAVAAFGRLA